MSNFIQIENKAGKVRLNDSVHKDSANKLIDEIEKLYGNKAVAAKMVLGDVVCSAENALESIEVEINTPGGSVFEGQRIYNTLRALSGRGVNVVTTVNGLAASMGSVILMAGDERRMEKGSRVMIHEASTIAQGDARAMRKQADLLDGISAEIAGIYAERTGGDEKELRQLMLAETWMTAEQAKANGFIHAIIKDGKPENSGEVDIRATMPITKPMNLIQAIKDLLPSVSNDDADKLAAHVNEVESLSADLVAAQTQIDELKGLSAVVAEKDLEISNLTTANATLRAELETKEASIAELQNELTKAQSDIEAAKQSAGTQAIEVLASIGQPEPLVDASTTAEPEDLIKTLAKLKGAERTEFYAKHSKEIRKLLTKQPTL